MKILIASSSPCDKGGGISSYAKELCEGLIEKGHKIVFLSPSPENHSWLSENNISFYPINRSENAESAIKQIIKIIKDQSVEAIINNDNTFVQLTAPIIDCPFISVVHSSRTNILSLACFNHEWIDYIVTISNDMMDKVINKFDIPITKTPIIYNGVKAPKNTSVNNKDNNDKLKIIFNGGNKKHKGAHLILSALSKYKSVFNNTEIHWFGYLPGDWDKKLSQYDCVLNHGRVPRDEMLSHLSKADIFLLPSSFEGCPMSLLEAMSFGLVPIVSDGEGAMPNIVTNGIEGMKCYLNNWEKQIAESITQLNTNRALLKRMKENSYTRFQQDFQRSDTINRLLFHIDNPIVNRNNKPEIIQLLKWHRPFRKDMKKAPFIDRIFIKLGLLRKDKKIKTKTIVSNIKG